MITDNSLKSILEDWNNAMKSANAADLSVKLTQKEMGFLITCIYTTANEGFPYSPMYYDIFNRDLGIKYESLNFEEIMSLVEKLGGDEDDKEMIKNSYILY